MLEELSSEERDVRSCGDCNDSYSLASGRVLTPVSLRYGQHSSYRRESVPDHFSLALIMGIS